MFLQSFRSLIIKISYYTIRSLIVKLLSFLEHKFTPSGSVVLDVNAANAWEFGQI